MPVIGYYNGQYVNPSTAVIPIDERGHQFGDGIYEVIRVYGGRPFLLDWHLERLMGSLRAVRIDSPHDESGFRALILEAIAKSGEPEASVYLQVTRGATVRNHLFPAPDSTNPGVSLVVRPLSAPNSTAPGKLLVQPDERWANAYIKTINLLPNILAKQAAHDVGADEALLVRDGDMLESASSNLWFIEDGRLVTAPLDRFILPGITRRFVIGIAKELSIPVEEKKVPFTSLDTMDGIFITGTVSEILPIEAVLGHKDLPITANLAQQSPHPLNFLETDCETIWRSRNLEVAYQLKQAFNAKVDVFRSSNA